MGYPSAIADDQEGLAPEGEFGRAGREYARFYVF
jgi:hypothetical protein